ncbi:hypothetical protein CYMTET_38138 [Cymbomonas tetramitiformis]|uniref:Ion transport domain-containing protein n=1 Tax=Cymbomonas tetramitiformis TaxID=36881 RepID=A0AAE0CE43_9CHLO|nr:hypothetical protein CYMTET_38138 [Cymbomonas tetramitiformis]
MSRVEEEDNPLRAVELARPRVSRSKRSISEAVKNTQFEESLSPNQETLRANSFSTRQQIQPPSAEIAQIIEEDFKEPNTGDGASRISANHASTSYGEKVKADSKTPPPSVGVLPKGRKPLPQGPSNTVATVKTSIACQTEADLGDKSLFLFSGHNRIRIKARWVIEQSWFDRFILVVIFFSCINVAVQEDLGTTDGVFFEFLEGMDLAFTAVFFMELIIKAVALGFLLDQGAYLRDAWNVMDFLVVVSAILERTNFVDTSFLVVLRVMRILRPLRFVQRFPELQTLVETLFSSLAMLGQVIIITIFFLVIFGVLGIQWFKGAFHYACHEKLEDGSPGAPADPFWRCTNSNKFIGAYSCSENQVCSYVEENPAKDVVSFDNAFDAMLAIFQSMTLEGWVDITYDLMDSRGTSCVAYMLLIVLIGNFGLMNLALAVIFESYQESKALVIAKQKRMELAQELLYQELKEAEEAERAKLEAEDAERAKLEAEDASRKSINRPDTVMITATEGITNGVASITNSVKNVEQSLTLREDHPINLFKARLLRFLQHPITEYSVMFVVLVNIAVLCCAHHDMSKQLEMILYNLNVACTSIFVVELLAKLVAMPMQVFFDDWMNPFDAAVVLISTLTELLSGGGGAIGAFRSLRVIRIFKLAKGWKSLQAFLESAAKAISAAFPMVALMSIFIFLFTILGLKLFKGKDLDPDRDLYGNIYFAMLSTIQVISGENWNELMYGGYSEIGALGIFYFVILYIIGNTLLFNLFVAILIDAFVAHHDEDTKGDEGEDTSSGEEATPSESQTPRNSMSEPIVPSLTGHKLMIFSPTNPLRTFLHKMVFTDAFEYVVTFFICLSCLNLILLTYDVEEGSNLHKYTEFCSWLTAITFMVEMCMKLVVMGLYRGEGAYTRDAWNVADGITAVVTVLSLHFPSVSWVRFFRVLRPLRLISRLLFMRVILSCLMIALVKSISIAIVGFLMWITFSVVGLQLFMGSYYNCSDSSISRRDDCTGLSPEGVQREWMLTTDHTFDDIFQSMITTFEIATLEMWPSIMWTGVDSTGPDEAWVLGSNKRSYLAVYFVFVLILLAFFLINLFVGIVIDTFNEYKQSTYKSTSTPSALADEWLEMEVDLGGLSCNSDPLPPSWIYQQYVYRIVMDKKFEKLTILIICLNLLPLLMEHYQQPDSLTEFLSISSITFTTIFCVEMVVKLFGLGPAGYCRSMWNLLDALCVLTTLFLGPWVASIRMVRLTRILRLVRTSPMKKLVMALVQALPGILQTGMLLLLVLFIYSMLGILMFKDVVHGEFLNRHVNFSNFSTAMFLLFRCATGESYNGIMFELAVTEPDCDRSEGNCGSWIAIPFMFSFVVFVQMILLNIFIAVVLSSYSDIALAEGRVISMFYVQMIHDRWCEKDTLQTGVLSMEKVFEIIQEIPKPLGIAKENSLHKIEPPLTEGEMFSVNRLLLPHLKGMGLELVEGHVHHRHFLFAMVCAAFIKTADNIDEETIDFVCKRAKRHAPSHSKLLTSNMSSMKRPRLLSTSFKRNRPRTESGSVVKIFPLEEVMAVSIIEKYYRSYLIRKEMKKIGTSPSSLMVNHMVGAKMTSTQPKAGDLGRDATEIRRFEIPDDEESKEGILHHFGKQSAAQLARTKEKRDEQAMRLAEKRLDAEEENQERMARGGSAEASRF